MSLQQNSEEKSMMEILVDYFNEQVFTNQSASLQRFQTALPSICLQGRKEQVTQRANILGEYKASMDFAIVIRIDKDTLPMEVYRIFDDVHKQLILHQERVIYPILPNGYRCCSLQHTHPLIIANIGRKLNAIIDCDTDIINVFTLIKVPE